MILMMLQFRIRTTISLILTFTNVLLLSVVSTDHFTTEAFTLERPSLFTTTRTRTSKHNVKQRNNQQLYVSFDDRNQSTSSSSSESQSPKIEIISTPILLENDDESQCPDDSCLLSMLPEFGEDQIKQLAKNTMETTIFNPILIIPILSPILAYMTYDDIARLFASAFDYLTSDRTWVPVDGGAYQARIIAPAINGIVVPAISILFATLISNTVATLRQRQIDIHTSLNIEAGDLRFLSSMVEAFPNSEQKNKCREYLTQYTMRLIGESSDEIKFNSVEFQGSTDSEMNAFVTILNQLVLRKNDETSSRDNDTTTATSVNITPQSNIMSESYGAVVRLNSQRSSRITAIQSTFPTLHYTILGTLAASICLAFLLETNQELLIFLNATQLRILWTMLIGTFSALAVVCYDLSGPFRGQYQISNAVYQLITIRSTLKAAVTSEGGDDGMSLS